MNIAFFSSEVFPFSKTGGLADVAGSLPPAINKFGNEIRVFTPLYNSIDSEKFGLKRENTLLAQVKLSGKSHSAEIYSADIPGSTVTVYFISSNDYFNRDTIYTQDDDEDSRFIFYQKAALKLIELLNWTPDILHSNDWQTGLIPFYAKFSGKEFPKVNGIPSLFTIHNIGYQGQFPKTTLQKTGISKNHFYPGSPVEFHGFFNFLKAGLTTSTFLNTVSKTYAAELLTEEYGAGMEGVLLERKSKLFGIVNGVDYNEWDPNSDSRIPAKYSPADLSGKRQNKSALMKKFGLPVNPKIPVIGIVSRIAYQKGFDIIAEAIPKIVGMGANLVILGTGEKRYEKSVKKLAKQFPQNIGLHIGYSAELSHLIEAGSDMFLMPSRYEPCGLNQIYSLKYGTIPIVRKTGGLADTVTDFYEAKIANTTATGFSFKDYSAKALTGAVRRALKIYSSADEWKKLQLNGMKMDYSWNQSAEQYDKLYSRLAEFK